MKKRLLFILGILLIFLAFVLYKYSIYRFILMLLGIGIIMYQCIINKVHKAIIIIVTILLLLVTFGIDFVLSNHFNRIPIYALKIKSSDNMSVYNSAFYRVYDCNSKLITDKGYKKAYACNESDLEEHDINSFLNESIKSYQEYHNRFIKLNGKISKLSGVDVIELSSYKQGEDLLNGYVVFNTDYTVRLTTDYDITKLKIFDNITVIGLVSSIEQQNESYLITLIDTVIIPSDIYESYTIEVVENDSKELSDFVEKMNYYKLGLDNIYVHYDQDNIYELSYLITDSRITIDDLIADIEYTELNNKDDEVIAQKYTLDKYSILKCKNVDKVIFANKKAKLTIDYCK